VIFSHIEDLMDSGMTPDEAGEPCTMGEIQQAISAHNADPYYVFKLEFLVRRVERLKQELDLLASRPP